MGLIRFLRYPLAALMLAQLAACGAEPLSLEQALSEGRVKATFINTGYSSGDVCVGDFEYVQGSAFTLDIPRGTILRNGDDDRESFVVVKVRGEQEALDSEEFIRKGSVIIRPERRHVLATLECYSIDALLEGSNPNDILTLDGLVSGETKAVVDALETPDNPGANQVAVWAATDDVTREELSEVEYEVSDGEILMARSIVERANLDPDTFMIFR